MPNAVVKSYAEKTGKSVEHVERWWEEAKEEASKKFKKKSKNFWAYVNGIVKRRAGLSEELTFKDYMKLEELMNEERLDELFGKKSKMRDYKLNARDKIKISDNEQGIYTVVEHVVQQLKSSNLGRVFASDDHMHGGTDGRGHFNVSLANYKKDGKQPRFTIIADNSDTIHVQTDNERETGFAVKTLKIKIDGNSVEGIAAEIENFIKNELKKKGFEFSKINESTRLKELDNMLDEGVKDEVKKITTKIFNKAYNLTNPDFNKVPYDKAGNQVVYVNKNSLHAGKNYMSHIFYYLVDELKMDIAAPHDYYEDRTMFSSHEIFKVKKDYLLEINIIGASKIEVSVYMKDEDHGDGPLDKIAARVDRRHGTTTRPKNKREEMSFSMSKKSIQEMAVEINQFLNQAIKTLNRG